MTNKKEKMKLEEAQKIVNDNYNKKNVQIIDKKDFDPDKFIEKAESVDLDLIIKHKWRDYENYTRTELALISYLSPKISSRTTPMLFLQWKRVYTYDIPLKIEEFFEREINYTPNDNWIIEKTKLPSIQRFLIQNKITDNQWYYWLNKANHDPNLYQLQNAMSFAKQWVEALIIEWWMEWMYNWNFAQFLAKNIIPELKDEVKHTHDINIGAKNDDLSNLSPEELQKILDNPKGYLQQRKALWNWTKDNSDDSEYWIIDAEIVEE